MRGLTIADLPPPPDGKHGWPWTSAESPFASITSSFVTESSPRISIVTPSYNQGEFLEEAIRSVLLQDYSDIEYIIQDGGSTDGSVDIIRKYEPWLSHWSSGRDDGQSAAINQGFDRATGDILAWINADDGYLQGAFELAARQLAHQPAAVLVHGHCVFVDESSRSIAQPTVQIVPSPTLEEILTERGVVWQPSVFMRHTAFKKVGPLDPTLYFSMDYELWLRLRKLGEFAFHGLAPVAFFRSQSNAKTFALPLAMSAERYVVNQRFGESGVITACRTLQTRWTGLLDGDLEVGSNTIIADLASDQFRSFPAAVRRAARPLIGEILGDAGFRAAQSGRLRLATRCFRAAVAYRPSLLLNRGVYAIGLRALRSE